MTSRLLSPGAGQDVHQIEPDVVQRRKVEELCLDLGIRAERCGAVLTECRALVLLWHVSFRG